MDHRPLRVSSSPPFRLFHLPPGTLTSISTSTSTATSLFPFNLLFKPQVKEIKRWIRDKGWGRKSHDVSTYIRDRSPHHATPLYTASHLTTTSPHLTTPHNTSPSLIECCRRATFLEKKKLNLLGCYLVHKNPF